MAKGTNQKLKLYYLVQIMLAKTLLFDREFRKAAEEFMENYEK